MSKVLVTESSLSGIAAAIRAKNGSSDTYKPGQMAAAIQAIPTGTTPTGTVNITQNGTVDVTDYASADVAVPNSYAAGDEGKVVSNGALVAQTARALPIMDNGTYDTTNNNSVTVNVSGGDDGYMRGGLMARYDGINNTGSGHSTSATTWSDISGCGNDATIINGTWADDALIFNGISTYAVFPQHVYGEKFTVECVLDGRTDVKQTIYCRKGFDDEGTIYFVLISGSGTIRTVLMLNGSSYGVSGPIYNGGKIYVAFTYNGSEIVMYVNGQRYASNSATDYIRHCNNRIYNMIGSQDDNVVVPLNGKMYHFAFYTTALTDAQIASNYNYLAARFAIGGNA